MNNLSRGLDMLGEAIGNILSLAVVAVPFAILIGIKEFTTSGGM